MQVQPLFAQRLPVIRHIQQRRVVAGQGGQRIDGPGQHVVRVAQGIVVGVDDLLPAAAPQVRGFADRGEPLECGRIAFEVGRAMVAQHVQDDHLVALVAARGIGQSLQQDAVMAAHAVA